MKIMVHSMDGTGHINACLGMSQTLQSRGHDVFFAINEDLSGNCARFGFREIPLIKSKKLLDQNNNEISDEDKTKNKENITKMFGKQLLDSGLLSGRSSLEKLSCISPEQENDDSNYVKTLYELLLDFIPQLEQIMEQEKPDCIILDHFLLPPLIAKSSIPWIFLFSGNPLPLFRDSSLPPPNSGYALPKKDDEEWDVFREKLAKLYFRSFYDYQIKLNDDFGFVPEIKPDPHYFVFQSPYLNIYQYPEELDYYPEDKIPSKYARVDAFIREEVQPFKIPEKLLNNRSECSRLIYLSLGSMGCYDIDLMKRIIGALSKTSHKVIVSKGTRGDEYELPDNCWGENFLPQPKIMPLVDLVITHGGNNTVTEAFSLGKPMIILPLFADQYDNAQRLDELGYGVRLETYAFTDDQMISALDKLLNDEELKQKLSKIAEKIKIKNRKQKACEIIEKIVSNISKS